MSLALTNTVHPWSYLAGALLVAAIPIIIGATTSYLKVSLALTLLRNGFGAQHIPSGLAVMVLSLAITAFVMQPVIHEVSQKIKEIEVSEISFPLSQNTRDKLVEIVSPWRAFLEKHVGEREKRALTALLIEKSQETPENAVVLGAGRETAVLLVAFVISELKQGLVIGFVLLLPFLVIDLVVSTILAGLGMYMVSPVMISLPLKLLLFAFADGWLLIVRGLIGSYL